MVSLWPVTTIHESTLFCSKRQGLKTGTILISNSRMQIAKNPTVAAILITIFTDSRDVDQTLQLEILYQFSAKHHIPSGRG
jgi:hypothetical protein